MTQPPTPQAGTPSSTHSQTSASQIGSPNTRSGKLTRKFLDNILEPLDELGNALMGDLWRTFYLSVQDAIAMSLLLQIPGLIGQWILGKSFSDFAVCLRESSTTPTRYACFVIVASDFLLWIILTARIVGRFWAELSDLWKKKGGSGHGSKQP
jgi:hypothetical protein